MSIAKTKDQLISLLNNPDNSVIALSGKWGSGKTHLWNEVKNESADEKVKKSLYVSLFGLSTVDQVKRKLIETSVPGVESHGGAFDFLKSLFKVGVKVGSEHYKALAALNDLNVILMAPIVLGASVVVIDDIERKNEKLGIDEILGFIDEYSKQYRVRFILVLNDDQLTTHGDQAKLWTTFREKVIDQEIRLSTTPEEACSIAASIVNSRYAEAIKRASITCGITNIRILVKIIRVANQILGDRDLDDAILARVIPSTVLLSAIHYRGLANGPDFKFVLSGNLARFGIGRDDTKDPTEQEKLEDGWRMMINELGISGCDEFEENLIAFLESGLFDAAAIESIVARYVLEKDAMHAREDANHYLRRLFWDHRLGDSQLLAEAASFPPRAGLLDPYVVTMLDTEISKLPGGSAVGEAIVDGWLTSFRATAPTDISDSNPFNNPLHPRIAAEFASIKATAQSNSSVLDACMHILEHSGWGTMQEITLQRATPDDFEAAIRNLQDLDEFRRFMRHMIDMRIQRATYDVHFGTATQHFVDACRRIANDPTSPRLAALLIRLFEKTTIAAEIVAPPIPATA